MEDYSSVSRRLVGIVRIDISSLAFQDDLEAKKIDYSKVQDLVDKFSDDGCERDRSENQVPALVSSRELDYILETAQVTPMDLQRSLLEGEYPTLYMANNKIYCLEGRHRLRAAELFFKDQPGENWWTVRLSTFNPSVHETRFSDGEVLRKVIYYLRRFRGDLAEDWKIRLTKCRQDCLSVVMARRDFTEALEKVLRFPGLSDGVKLSYWKGYLALRSDEELLNCLKHLHDTWSRITLGSTVVEQAVDISTVHKLQNRAPSASHIDRLYIVREMDEGGLFPAIVDRTLRQLIKEAILGLRTMIPSFKYFHENVNYFAIPAKMIQTELIDGPIRTTMRRTLYDHWSPPGSVLEEVREGEYQPAALPDGLSPTLFAYLQLFLGEMRHFPCRSKHYPKMERKRKRGSEAAPQGHVDTACRTGAFERARLLGFRTNKIIEGLRSASAEGVEFAEHFPEGDEGEGEGEGEGEKRRSGRPFTNAYKQLRTQLFLANLYQGQAGLTAHPPVLFIQRDFIEAFFGWTAPDVAPFGVSAGVAVEATAPDLRPTVVPSLSLDSSPSDLSPLPAPQARRLGLPVDIRERWDQISRELGIRHDSDTEGEMSRPRPRAGSVPDERCSLTGDLDDDRRSFPVLEGGVSEIPRLGEDEGRRSFPALERRASLLDDRPPASDDERRSFPAPLGTALAPERTRQLTSAEDRFTFVEFDGRGQEVISTNDIDGYLQGRRGWTMMALKNQVLKTVRFSRVVEHMLRGGGEYFLMAPHIAREFRREYVNHLRQL